MSPAVTAGGGLPHRTSGFGASRGLCKVRMEDEKIPGERRIMRVDLEVS